MRTLAADRASDSAPLSDRLWQTLFQNPHVGLAIVGPDRHFVETNERFQQLVGYTARELRAMTVLEIIHPDDRAQHRKRADAIRSGASRNLQIEKRYIRKNGEVVSVRVTALMVPEPEGKPAYALAIVEDVTERRDAELDALGKERRLRLVVGQVPAIVWTTDRDLRFTSSFGAGLRGLGLEADEVVGRSALDFAEGPDAVEISAHRRALAGESCTYYPTYRDRSFQVHLDPLRDEEGNIVGVIGVGRGHFRAATADRRPPARIGGPLPTPLRRQPVADVGHGRRDVPVFLAVNDAALRHYGYSRDRGSSR